MVELEPLGSGFDRPVLVTHAGDGSGRLFVVEQTGRIRILRDGALLATPFLDLSAKVACCGERGLLGLAFHPGYAENGTFFVDYTATDGATVISRFRVSGDPDRADVGSEREILRVPQPFSNHNGGHLAFGPNGMLYAALGDGGGAGDPQNHGQRLDTLLGKILRLDVDAGEPYAVPDDNPFAGEPGAQREIWAYGLRNPWRFSFDRKTGDLYMGDVGQNRVEEINFQPGSSAGGDNYGWRLREGRRCFEPPTGCPSAGLVPPIAEYEHDRGCSVTGGYRYRGPDAVTLPRYYFFGDFCSGRIWGARANRSGGWHQRVVLNSQLNISSFGEDEQGRIYVADHAVGSVWRLAGRPLLASGFETGDLSQWSRRRGGVEVVAPGLAGSGFALRVPVDGTSRRAFVRSNDPEREETFEGCFRLDANRIELGAGEVEIYRLSGPAGVARLFLGERAQGGYLARLEAREAAGWRDVGSTKVPAAGAARLCVGWSSATAPRTADGEALLSKNGRVRAAADDLDNFGLRVRNARLGLPSGSAGLAAAGAFLLDDYVSTP